MFFLDVSETCGYSIEQQVALFHSIKPLFKSKPLLVVLNKTDAKPLDALTTEQKAQIETMRIEDNVTFLSTSCLTSVGIDDAKNTACELLLKQRVESKVAQNKDVQVASRIHITSVVTSAARPPCIPQGVIERRAAIEAGIELPPKRKTLKDVQEANGGAGAFSADLRKEWMVKHEDWRYDAVPEIMDGMNVADWIDPDIDRKLAELEAEEEALLWGDQDDEAEAAQYKQVQKTLAQVHSVMEQQKLENRLRTNISRKAIVRRKNPVKVSDAEANLALMGVEVESLGHRASAPKRKREEATEGDEDAMELDTPKRRNTHRVSASGLSGAGTNNPNVAAAAELHKRKTTRRLAKLGKKGEADRFVSVAKPKHLFSGKRGNGKTDRR
jgi:nucleolar GTP-binding protein